MNFRKNKSLPKERRRGRFAMLMAFFYLAFLFQGNPISAQIPEQYDKLQKEASDPVLQDNHEIQGPVQQFDPSQFSPMPVPEGGPSGPNSEFSSDRVSFELATRTEYQLGKPTLLRGTTEGSTPAGPSAFESRTNNDPVRNFGSLRRVVNSSAYPNSFNAKIFITFPNGDQLVGSAILISPYWALTAAHAIYDAGRGGWASSVRVVPAYENGNEPYCHASAHWFHSWSGWTSEGKWEWDMGYIELDRPIGCLTGWAGRGWNSNNNFFRTTTFENPGYPAASPYSGQFMFTWRGFYDEVTDHILRLNSASIPGQSGSGSMPSNLWVYAIQSHNSNGRAGQTRMNQSRYESISQTIDGAVPANPDLVPLGAYATGQRPGERLRSGGFLLYNYSSRVWSGTVRYGVYISTNANITTSDTWLQNRSITVTLQPHERKWVRFSSNLPRIPSNISGNRNYHVGVIITNQDHKTSNNRTTGCDAARIFLRSNNTSHVHPFVEKLEIFPNPVVDHLNLSLNLSKPSKLGFDLYDLTGKKVKELRSKELWTAGSHQLSFPIQGLPKGVYMLRIDGEEGRVIKKLVIGAQ